VPRTDLPHGYDDVCGLLLTNASNVHTNLELQAVFREAVTTILRINCGKVKHKAKFTLEQAMKAQRGRRGIAPLHL
jgi:hypothetical protein